MERAQWLELRKQGISGTDVGAILGLSKYKKPIDVFLEKRGLIESAEENPAMFWGTAQEPLIADYFAKRHEVELDEPGFMVHPEYSWVIGTPDRLIRGKQEGLEIKTANSRQFHLWGPGNVNGEESDEIPDVYLCQCAWYMLLTDYPTWHVAVKIDSADYREYTIHRNERLEGRIFAICKYFYEHNILKGIPPAPDESESYAKYIQDSFPKDSGELITVESGESILGTVERLKELNEALDKIEEDKHLLVNTIKAYIGGAAGIKGDGWKITWKTSKSSTKVDYKKLSEFLAMELKHHIKPQIIEDLTAECTETKPGSRRFLPTFA